MLFRLLHECLKQFDEANKAHSNRYILRSCVKESSGFAECAVHGRAFHSVGLHKQNYNHQHTRFPAYSVGPLSRSCWDNHSLHVHMAYCICDLFSTMATPAAFFSLDAEVPEQMLNYVVDLLSVRIFVVETDWAEVPQARTLWTFSRTIHL